MIDSFSYVLSDIFDAITEFLRNELPDIALAFLVVASSVVVGRYIAQIVRNQSNKVVKSRSLQNLTATLSKIAIVFIGIVAGLRILGLDDAVASMLAGAGIIGLALGFAFQDAASNFIAGVILSVNNKVKVGDLVEIQETLGIVKLISLRLTEVRTLEGQIVYVPNKELLSSSIEDYSRLGRRRIDLLVGVSYSDDLELVEKVTLEALNTVENKDNKQPVDMYFTEFGESSINLTARFWIKFGNKQSEFLQARSDAIKAIKQAYDKAGISIPYPITTLDIDSKTVKSFIE